ncbi:hypothetical protein D9O50_09945 [Oxalobacteraceae bacterium CAVE-383]|nr:hypothetical protein D9O50_09945 [Oxalobacteraceae bacterium CAVE-383]
MNPSFSPAASSAIFHPSGFTPDFFKPLPPPAADAAEGISFPRHAGETIAEFRQSADFPGFKREFMAHIECIKQFATEYLGDEAHGVHVAFDEFTGKLFDDGSDFFEGEENILYGVGKRSLEQLSVRLADAGIEPARRQTCVLELAEGIGQCAGGAAVNLAEAAQSLQSAHESQFLRAKNEVATALITEAYLHLTAEPAPVAFTLKIGAMPVPRIPVQFEIHCATSLRNAVAECLGLAKHVDHVADNCEFSSEAIGYCLQYISQRLTAAGLAKGLAEKYLHDFRQPVAAALAQDTVGTASGIMHGDGDRVFKYRKWSGRLADARETLKGYGEVRMVSLITAVGPHRRKFRLNADSTLVALDILDYQRRNGAVAASYRPETLMHWRHGEKEISIQYIAEQLAWAVENGEARLLDTKHLMLISPKDFQGRERTAELIAANVRKNSSPEVQQACLSPEWLSVLDCADVFAAWTPAALSLYLKRHAMRIAMLPRSGFLSIVKGVAACGSKADLDMCVPHGSVMFEAPAGSAPPDFFRIALLRGDVLIFNAVLRRFEEGMSKSDRIRRQAGAIIASADAQGVVAAAGAYLKPGHNPVLSAYHNIAMRAVRNRLMTAAQFEDILAAKNGRGTAGLVFAIKNDDCEKIREFGAILLDAFACGLLDSAQCAKLLSAPTRAGIPALLIAVRENLSDAITVFGGVVIAANISKAINRGQAFSLLSAHAWADCSALAFAAASGKCNAVLGFGKVIAVAASKGVLTNAQVYRLLQGRPALGQQLLEMALCLGHFDAVKALGNLYLNLYMEGFLDRGQIRALLSGKTSESTQELIGVLTHGRDAEAATALLGNIIVTAECILNDNDDPTPLFLSAANASPSIDLRTLAVARSSPALRALAADMRALCDQVESGLAVCGHVRAQFGILAQQMLRSRIGLFFDPGEPAEGPRLFAEIWEQWKRLDQIQ